MEPYHDSPAAKRLIRQYTPRAVTFAPTAASAGAQLARLPAHTDAVYLTGPRPIEWRAWATRDLDGTGYAATTSYEEGAHPILRYTHQSGQRVELHRAASWFGPGDYRPDVAADAWRILGDVLGAAFTQPGRGGPVRPCLLATPATTGRDLWLRTIPKGRRFPALDADTQDFLRRTLGQARVQGPDTLAADLQGHMLPGLYEYDGRLMYSALCWELPVGRPHRDYANELGDTYARGRYDVALQVPDDWPHPFGLIGVPADGGGARWHYPATPGRIVRGWIDAAELRVALRAGWPLVRVHERFLFPRTTQRGPLDTWARRLVLVRDFLDPQALPDADPAALDLARYAVRQLLITAIGAFQGTPHTVTRRHPVADGTDGVPLDRARIDGDHFVWPETTPPAWPGLAHPEWAAAVWGRARARLLVAPDQSGALHLARGTRVVAFRTDALYVTGPQNWPDNLTVGRYRLARATNQPLPTPADNAALLRARANLQRVA